VCPPCEELCQVRGQTGGNASFAVLIIPEEKEVECYFFSFWKKNIINDCMLRYKGKLRKMYGIYQSMLQKGFVKFQ